MFDPAQSSHYAMSDLPIIGGLVIAGVIVALPILWVIYTKLKLAKFMRELSPTSYFDRSDFKRFNPETHRIVYLKPDLDTNDGDLFISDGSERYGKLTRRNMDLFDNGFYFLTRQGTFRELSMSLIKSPNTERLAIQLHGPRGIFLEYTVKSISGETLPHKIEVSFDGSNFILTMNKEVLGMLFKPHAKGPWDFLVISKSVSPMDSVMIWFALLWSRFPREVDSL